jgi:hypothetical protein
MAASFSPPVKPSVDESRIGECAPMQPVSGIMVVGETFAVNGMGRGGYVRTEKTEKNKSENFRLPVSEGRA